MGIGISNINNISGVGSKSTGPSKAVVTWVTTSLGAFDYLTPYSLQLQVTITPAGKPITYFIASGSLPSGLTLNSSTGIISGTPLTIQNYDVTISAQDASDPFGNPANREFTGSTTSQNDIVVFVNNGSVTLFQGEPTSFTYTAISSSGNPLTYSISSGALPAGLTLDSGTGTLSGTPTGTGNYAYTVTATDGIASQDFNVNGFIVPVVSFETTSVSLVQGSAASPSQIVADDSLGNPLTYSITAGTLPDGLTMDSSGNLTGAPTGNGSYDFTVTADDGTYNNTQEFTGTISDDVITFSDDPSTLVINNTTNTNYYVAASSSLGNTITFVVTAGTLPDGLNLDPDSGLISGQTTDGVGPYDFTVTATDGIASNTQEYTGNIGTDVITFNNTASLNMTQNTAVNYSAAATSSIGNTITYSISAGTLPTGLTLDPNSGTISGTPTSTGSYDFTVTADDGVITNSKEFTGTIGAAETPIVVTSTYTGVAPANCTGVQYTLVGGGGGCGAFLNGASTGGNGATATGTLSANPGDSIKVYVGGGGGGGFAGAGGGGGSGWYGGQGGGTYGGNYSAGGGGGSTALLNVTQNTHAYASGGNGANGYYGGTSENAQGGYGGSNVGGNNTTGSHGTAGSSLKGGAGESGTGTGAGGGNAGTGGALGGDAGGGGGYGGAGGGVLVSGSKSSPVYTEYAGGSNGANSGDGTLGALHGSSGAGGTGSSGSYYHGGQGGAATISYVIGSTTTDYITWITTSLPSASGNQAYSTTLAAQSSTGLPITYSIASGSLPSGLTLDSSTGIISGTPANVSGNYNLTFTANDGTSSGNSQQLTLNVMAIVPIWQTAAGSLGYFATNSSISTRLIATEVGNPTLTYTVTGGTLPDGITLSSDGYLTGTITSAGTFTVTVDDGMGDTATRSFSMNIATKPVINNPAGSIGGWQRSLPVNTYGWNITPNGQPYDFYISNGSLPPGLIIGQVSGAITGTPTADGTYSFTLRVVVGSIGNETDIYTEKNFSMTIFG